MVFGYIKSVGFGWHQNGTYEQRVRVARDKKWKGSFPAIPQIANDARIGNFVLYVSSLVYLMATQKS